MAGILDWTWPGNPIGPGGAGGAPASTLSNGLISYWSMDEIGGTRSTSVGSHSNDFLEVNEPVQSTPGKHDNAALLFSLSTGALVVDPSTLNLTDFTISGWIYLSSLTDSPWMVLQAGPGGGNDSVAIKRGPSMTDCYAIRWDSGPGSTFSLLSDLALDQWNHLVATYDSTTGVIKLWRNGSRTGVTDGPPRPGVPSITTPALYAGSQLASPADATVDELAIWDRVLLDAEVTELYNAGAGKFYPF